MEFSEFVTILDFGSQYTQLIARRIRELGVYSEIQRFDCPAYSIKKKAPIGLILSGGPSSVYEPNAPFPDSNIYKLGIPLLGICYGLQLIARQFGGSVDLSSKREYGKSELRILSNADLFSELCNCIQVWMSHGDTLRKLPDGFEVIASSTNSTPCAIRNLNSMIYGVQFHPEVVHTPDGQKILHNFLYKICKAKGGWNSESFVDKSIREIRDRVGSAGVICALGGGVDSSVLAVLLHKAIGKNLHCIHIDNGLMRKNESEQVIDTFKNKLNINVDCVDASGVFVSRLSGITDPEEKRKIIGKTFIEIFENGARKLDGRIEYLAQGTLYPDVIESVSFKGPSATIKTHHNVGGLPEKMKFKLLEPFRELFKDEVRGIGKLLGIPDGIIGEVTEDKLNFLREADYIFIDELRKTGLYDKVWQAFAVLLPVYSVGVMGDFRTYENVIALRAVTSVDGMTADWAKLPAELLSNVSNRITNELKGINRVVYDITSKPPATIKWE